MANTTNFNWETPDDTDLVKDGAAAIRTLGSAIDTSLVDLKGGTTNQVLAKNSNTDMDFKWVADASGIPATIFDAKGDLIVASAADTAARLAVGGTNGHVLTVNSSATNGIEWAAPAGGGKVLQVVSTTYTTRTDVTSTTYTDTGLTLNITPTSSSSKVLILITHNVDVYEGGNNPDANIRLMRGATAILNNMNLSSVSGSFKYSGISRAETNGVTFTYLDSPATTSATTYKTQMAVKNTANSSQITINGRTGSASVITLLEIGA